MIDGQDEPPATLDVDGYKDSNGWTFFGEATRQPNGLWRAVAAMTPRGPLCLVEVRITFPLATEVSP